MESPLQLLCAVEAHSAGLLGVETRLLVRDDVPGLQAALIALRQLGLPHGLTADTLSPRDVALGRARLHGVGDACSGLFQALLLIPGRVPRLTLYDDGLATLDLVTRLTEPSRPLLRPGKPAGRLRRGLGDAAGRALRRRARAGAVDLFTALHLTDPEVAQLDELGIRVLPNTLDWLRSQPQPDAIAEPTVVVGSAFVADGLVDPDVYVDWVASQTTRGPVCYVPHRRSAPEVLDRLATLPDVRVDVPGAPVEMRLRGLSTGQRVACLPTTAAVTLTSLLEPRGVPVVVQDVPEAWWTPRASADVRENLRAAVRHLPGSTAGAP